MMQQQMPAQIPEGLAALLSLTSAMQQGRVAPTTPDGQPTVAAQAAQAAQQQMGMQPQGGPPQGMPPGPEMQDVAQGAGMAAQQQAQQQQEMMQQLPQMIAAMQQRQQAMDQGIASAPGAQNVNMAEGGIVGYAEGGAPTWHGQRRWTDPYAKIASDRELARIAETDEAVRLGKRFPGASDEPEFQFNITQPTIEKAEALERQAAIPGLYTEEKEALLKEAAKIRALLSNQATQQVGGGGGDGGGGGIASMMGSAAMTAPALPPRVPQADYSASDKAYQDALEKAQGVRTQQATPQEILDSLKAQDEAKRQYAISRGVDPDVLANTLKKQQEIAERRQAMYEQQLAGVRERAPLDAITSFLTRGARGGRSLGEIMAAGAEGSAATRQANQARIEQLQELQVKHQEASATAAAALEKMRYDIAMGDYKSAMENRNTVISAENEKKKLEAEIMAKRAGELGARSRTETERDVQQRGQDIQARSQDVQMEIQRAQEAVRISLEEIKRQNAGDPRVDNMLRALNQDELYKGLVKRMENALTVADAQRARDEALAYQNVQRRLFKLPEAPAPTPPTYKYDPKTGLQPGK